MFDHADYQMIPDRILAALDALGRDGHVAGSFVMAVLSNDLADAITRADHENLPVIKNIVLYITNQLPDPCWGSTEKVEAWAKLERRPFETKKGAAA